jgi:hypothetical protein
MIRRTFLSRLGSAGALFGLKGRSAEAFSSYEADPRSTAPDGLWQPARHAADDWFDERPGKHRLLFDALSPKGSEEALMFASNFFLANKTAYGIENSDLAVAICFRHHATPFAFNDAMWTKYGAAFSDRLDFTDPKTRLPATVNVHAAALATAVKQGVQFAVCDMASHFFAGLAARRTGGDADAVYRELTSNSVGNCHFVAAGIVAVNRAQERGYSIAYVG